jgi:hypothetical protein
MFRAVVGDLKLRRQRRPQEGDERMLALVFQQGYDARMAGKPCTPPEGYAVKIGHDLVGEWIAGWAKADRELGVEPEQVVDRGK